jgi:hypothetical protein
MDNVCIAIGVLASCVLGVGVFLFMELHRIADALWYMIERLEIPERGTAAEDRHG